MLKRYSELLRTTLVLTDLGLVAGAWLAAYALRFHGGFEAPLGVPPLGPYLACLGLIVPTWWLLFRARGLYEPRRTGSVLAELGAIAGATTAGVLLLIAASFFVRHYFLSRGVIALFFGLSLLSVSACRLAIRGVLRQARRRGHNLRYVLLAGAGRVAEQVVERIHAHPEAGLRVVGALSDDLSVRELRGVPVLGGYAALKEVLARGDVDQVILALPREEADRSDKLLAELEDELVTVSLVPDLRHVLTLRSRVEDLDGLPVISLRESPLVGLAALHKRSFDLAVSGALLLALAPLLALVAGLLRLSQGAPVLYRQERMGLDGRLFRILKFRTMGPDAELRTGPVWSRIDDPRRTRLGAWLRRSGLDELPQLWNVLRGDMSLVGPRPERPEFIERFRREVPGYMLRHKTKAGLTGWAQVHGWRGDTCLQERVEHDLHYIQNWSLSLDLRILFMTLWRLGGGEHGR